MMKNYRFILFVLFIFIGGCSSGDDKTTSEQSSKQSISNDQMQALGKAKEVEQVLKMGMDERDNTVDEESN